MSSRGLAGKKSSRSGRYRKRLMTPADLVPFASKLESLFKTLETKKNSRNINDAEFLSYGLLAMLACRRPDAFEKSASKTQFNSSVLSPASHFSFSHFLELFAQLDLPIIAFKKSVEKESSLLEFLNSHRLRGIPDSARHALLEWLHQKYPLTLFFYIPSVSEVFELQKRGGRCVSFFKNAHELTHLHHERDVISFMIHDLIHAHEFYSNPERAVQQIGFYHWLDNIQANPQLQNLLNDSMGFKECWEYVLADMNSYCGHLLKTLRAAFALHAKNGDGEEIWRAIVEESNLHPIEQRLFLKVNTHGWKDDDFVHLEKIFESRRFQY